MIQLSKYSVFHGGVTPVSVLTLKPLLGIIGAILLKPQVCYRLKTLELVKRLNLV